MTADGQAVGTDEGGQHADEENGDIRRRIMFAQDARIGIVENRNQDAAVEYSCAQRRAGAGEIFFQALSHEERIQGHGKKEQLDMFPDGFIDRCKEAHKGAPARPVIQKVGKGAERGDEENSRCGVEK